MARYIDADALKRKLVAEKHFYPAIVARAIDETPTADVVEVVRCKDCKYHWEFFCENECWGIESPCPVVEPDDYCSYGVRSDSE